MLCCYMHISAMLSPAFRRRRMPNGLRQHSSTRTMSPRGQLFQNISKYMVLSHKWYSAVRHNTTNNADCTATSMLRWSYATADATQTDCFGKKSYEKSLKQDKEEIGKYETMFCRRRSQLYEYHQGRYTRSIHPAHERGPRPPIIIACFVANAVILPGLSRQRHGACSI